MRTALLVGKVRVVERRDAFVIPTAEQNAAQLGSCRSRKIPPLADSLPAMGQLSILAARFGDGLEVILKSDDSEPCAGWP